MATEESNIARRIQMDLSPHKVVLFKNVRGNFYSIGAVKKLIAAALTLKIVPVKSAIDFLRKRGRIAAGLSQDGSSDLIGYTQVLVTPDMVGTTVAIFTAVEVKTATGTVQPNQTKFCSVVNSHGGRAGIARNAQEAKKVAQIV